MSIERKGNFGFLLYLFIVVNSQYEKVLKNPQIKILQKSLEIVEVTPTKNGGDEKMIFIYH